MALSVNHSVNQTHTSGKTKTFIPQLYNIFPKKIGKDIHVPLRAKYFIKEKRKHCSSSHFFSPQSVNYSCSIKQKH